MEQRHLAERGLRLKAAGGYVHAQARALVLVLWIVRPELGFGLEGRYQALHFRLVVFTRSNPPAITESESGCYHPFLQHAFQAYRKHRM